MSPESLSHRERRLDELITAYFQAVETGQQPDPKAWLERYRDLAPELGSFFAAQKEVADRAGSRSSDAATIGLENREERDTAGVGDFGDYELLEEIARGGMGVVYKARQISLNRTVAIKMILKGALASESEVRRFCQEAEAAANLDHPNIVPIYEVGEHQGQHYFAMKLIEGSSLARSAASGEWQASKEGQRQGTRLVATAARAVHHAHQRGILHRDLKPGNILLDDQRQPHITDFGLAKHVEAGSDLTHSGTIVGTPSYMAPEQARSEKVLTTAIDTYSLGAILYELLTGRPPFRADTPLDTVLQVIHGELEAPRKVDRRIDRDLETICLKCLHRDPARRYESAAALADDLERWLRGEPILARPVGSLERLGKWVKRKPALASALTVSLLAALAILGGSLWVAAELRNERDQVQNNLSNSYIVLAENAWNHSGTAELARDYLDAVPPAFRKWEWNYLRGKYEGSLLTLHDQGGPDRTVAWSADNRLAISHHDTRTVRVLDARTGNPQLEIKGDATGVAWSHDSQRIAGAGSLDGRVWDAKTGELLLSLKGHTGPIHSIAWSPDDSQLASASDDRTVRVWDTRSGETRTTFNEFVWRPDAVAWSPDGRRLAIAGNELVVWDVPKRQMLWDSRKGEDLRFATLHPARIVAWSPDGKRIAGGSQEGEVRVWDADTGQRLLVLKGHSGFVRGISWSGDACLLATASYDGTVRVWDGCNGESLFVFKGHSDKVWSVCWSPDGRHLASTSEDKTVRIWEVRDHQGLRPLQSLNAVAWSQDGRWLAGASGDNMIHVWDPERGEPFSPYRKKDGSAMVLKGHSQHVYCVCWNNDGSRIATGGGDLEKSAELRIWDAHNGKPLLELKGHEGMVYSLAWSPDGKRLASAGSVSRKEATPVWIWDSQTGQPVLGLKTKGGRVSWSPDGSRLACASSRSVSIWNAETGQELLELQGHAYPVTAVTWSSDGQRLASADNTVRIWDVKTGQAQLVLAHAAGVGSICWSPDDSRLATGSMDGTVCIWDTRSGLALLTLKGHAHGPGVRSVAWTGTGRFASASNDMTIRIWDPPTRNDVRELSGHTLKVRDVGWVRDGRLRSDDVAGNRMYWDPSTATLHPESPTPEPAGAKGESPTDPFALVGAHYQSPDGNYFAWPQGKSILLMPAKLSDEELRRRMWLTRPDPQWHEKKHSDFAQRRHDYASAFHRSWEQHDRGMLAQERGDIEKARMLFRLAAELKPKATP